MPQHLDAFAASRTCVLPPSVSALSGATLPNTAPSNTVSSNTAPANTVPMFAPVIESQDDTVIASAVECRAAHHGGREWYVTWVSRECSWEISVMRLVAWRPDGRAWHHGRSVAYRVQWHVEFHSEHATDHQVLSYA